MTVMRILAETWTVEAMLLMKYCYLLFSSLGSPLYPKNTMKGEKGSFTATTEEKEEPYLATITISPGVKGPFFLKNTGNREYTGTIEISKLASFILPRDVSLPVFPVEVNWTLRVWGQNLERKMTSSALSMRKLGEATYLGRKKF